jgi:hypothetical protein
MSNRLKANSMSKQILSKAARAIGRSLPLMVSGAALTAGAGSLLMAGSAQAAWNPVTGGYSCTFSNGVGCTVNQKTPGAVGGDKFLTLLNWSSISNGSDLEFSYQSTDSTTPWHADLDFNPDDSDGGFLSYKIEATDGVFTRVNLISARDLPSGVTKTYGTRLLTDGFTVDPSSVIDTLNISSNVSDSGSAYGSVLYVNDSWTGPGAIDNISNEYAQSQVPGPVPVLGAAAAFGFSRRLRQRLKGASQAQN